MTTFPGLRACALIGVTASLLAGPALAGGSVQILRSVEVRGAPAAVWAAIGPFCAIGAWHPAIGACSLDGKALATRTLLTRDGKAKFVELQVARDDVAHSYSYTFTSSPVPVTHYVSTFSVTPGGEGLSTVTWRGYYVPDAGKAVAANAALSGIYESGLEAIRTKFAAAGVAPRSSGPGAARSH
jgi:hypothetical protein